MEFEFKTEQTTTLKLTNEEAAWLNAAMQNSLYPPEMESGADMAMRSKFYEATRAAAVSLRSGG